MRKFKGYSDMREGRADLEMRAGRKSFGHEILAYGRKIIGDL